MAHVAASELKTMTSSMLHVAEPDVKPLPVKLARTASKLMAFATVVQVPELAANLTTDLPATVVHARELLGTFVSHIGSRVFRVATCGPQSPSLCRRFAPDSAKHENLPLNFVVTVLVMVVVCDVICFVVVAVVVSVVKSHRRYAPDMNSVMALLSAATVRSHFALDVESFKWPLDAHCSVP